MKKIKIFISHSPKDTEKDCEEIKEIIKVDSEFLFEPKGFKLEAYCFKNVERGRGSPQNDYINPLIKKCDLIIILLWFVWGNPINGCSSGIEYEYELVKDMDKECLIFFSNKQVPPHTINPEDIRNIKEFKQRIENECAYTHTNICVIFLEKSFSLTSYCTSAVKVALSTL